MRIGRRPWMWVTRLRAVAFGLTVAAVLAAPLPVRAATVIHVDRGRPTAPTRVPARRRRRCARSVRARTAPSPVTPSSSSAAPYAEVVERGQTPAPRRQPIVIEAAPGETVTVQGGDRGFRVSSRSWVTIRGFHVVDTIGRGHHWSAAPRTSRSRATRSPEPVRPCPATSPRASTLASTTNSTVVHNNVHHNTDAGIYLGQRLHRQRHREIQHDFCERSGVHPCGRRHRRPSRRSNNGGRQRLVRQRGLGHQHLGRRTATRCSTTSSTATATTGSTTRAPSHTLIVSNTVYDSVDSGIEVVSSNGRDAGQQHQRRQRDRQAPHRREHPRGRLLCVDDHRWTTTSSTCPRRAS